VKIYLPADYGRLGNRKKESRLKKLEFSAVLEDTIFNLVRTHNVKYVKFPKKNVALDDARRVVKRGINTGTTEVALMRLRNFLSKKAGNPNLRYTEDDDLI
jgi:hypothetical protein